MRRRLHQSRPAARSLSSGWAGFAASRAGTLLYKTARDQARPVWYDRRGALLERLDTAGDILRARLSPDGRSVLFERPDSDLGTYDLWLCDLERGIEEQVTAGPSSEFSGVFMPDGKGMVFSQLFGGQPSLMRLDPASGESHPIAPRHTFQVADDVSADGRLLLFEERGLDSPWRLWTLDPSGDAEPRPLLRSQALRRGARLSPDGRYVAFLSDESGSLEAYAAAIASPDDTLRVSRAGASLLAWSRDGRPILYLAPDDRMMSVPIIDGPTFALGQPSALFVLPDGAAWNSFDLAPDGSILAVQVEVPGGAQPLSAIAGWSPAAAD